MNAVRARVTGPGGIGGATGEAAGDTGGEATGEAAGVGAGEAAGVMAGEVADIGASEGAGVGAGEVAGVGAGEGAGIRAGEVAGVEAAEEAAEPAAPDPAASESGAAVKAGRRLHRQSRPRRPRGRASAGGRGDRQSPEAVHEPDGTVHLTKSSKGCRWPAVTRRQGVPAAETETPSHQSKRVGR